MVHKLCAFSGYSKAPLMGWNGSHSLLFSCLCPGKQIISFFSHFYFSHFLSLCLVVGSSESFFLSLSISPPYILVDSSSATLAILLSNPFPFPRHFWASNFLMHHLLSIWCFCYCWNSLVATISIKSLNHLKVFFSSCSDMRYFFFFFFCDAGYLLYFFGRLLALYFVTHRWN